MKTSSYTYPVSLLFSLFILAACQEGQKDKPVAPTPDSTTSATTVPVPDSPAVTSSPAAPEDTNFTVAIGEAVNPADEKDSVTYCRAKKFYEKNGHTYIDADFIQLYTGDKAVEIARKYNEEVLDDVYMLNESKQIRSLAITDSAVYIMVHYASSKVDLAIVPKDSLLKYYRADNVYVLTIDKKTNTITKVKEQYFP